MAFRTGTPVPLSRPRSGIFFPADGSLRTPISQATGAEHAGRASSGLDVGAVWPSRCTILVRWSARVGRLRRLSSRALMLAAGSLIEHRHDAVVSGIDSHHLFARRERTW
jgi:hypothetical protein